MKRIKKIIIISFIILLSGCTAEYNLDIKDDIYSESIKITLNNMEEASIIENLSMNEQYISNTSTLDLIYDKEVEDDGEFSVFNYKHDFSFDEYRGTLNNKCFDNFKLQEENGIYSLTAYGFNCLNDHESFADTYKINIRTDYNVINNNADTVKGNVYTWNIDQKENKNKNIIFQYSKSNEKVPTDNIVIPVVICIVISILLLISIILFNTYKNNNRGE